jgi:tetratricopeptide (TPR) repeat protein
VVRPPYTAATSGTSSAPARQLFARGHAAIQQWNLALADSAFDAATKYDPGYAEAFLWLAQVRSWSGATAATWSYAAERAAAGREQLSVRDRTLVAALVALGRGDMNRACNLWRSLTHTEPRDFTGWYGLATCLGRDEAVVRDPASPSKWRFRSSYREALSAYQRAFILLPSMHKAFSADSYEQVRRLLRTSATYLRRGRMLPPDTLQFRAFASWHGDSLAFVPFPAGDVMRGLPGTFSTTVDEAVQHQRESFREIAAAWATAFPMSADAVTALAVALEMLGDVSALDTLRRARRLVRNPREQLRVAAAEVWMRVKFAIPDDQKGMRAARALADSLLSASRNGSSPEPRLLSSLAALTGRAHLAAALHRLPSLALELGAPPSIAGSVLPLLSYAAIGGPIDSLRALERRAVLAIDGSVVRRDQPATRRRWLARPATLAFPDYESAIVMQLAPSGDYLLDAQAALSRGDTAAVRDLMSYLGQNRRVFRSADLVIDAVYPEARLLVALGEHQAAIDWLDPVLGSLSASAPQLYADVARAGALVRAMALRTELAAHVGDRVGQRRWGRAVEILWSDADPFLQPTVRRMRALAR